MAEPRPSRTDFHFFEEIHWRIQFKKSVHWRNFLNSFWCKFLMHFIPKKMGIIDLTQKILQIDSVHNFFVWSHYLIFQI